MHPDLPHLPISPSRPCVAESRRGGMEEPFRLAGSIPWEPDKDPVAYIEEMRRRRAVRPIA